MLIPEKSLIHRLISNILKTDNGIIDRNELLEIAARIDSLLVALMSVAEDNLEHAETEEIIEITKRAMHLVKLNKSIEDRNARKNETD